MTLRILPLQPSLILLILLLTHRKIKIVLHLRVSIMTLLRHLSIIAQVAGRVTPVNIMMVAFQNNHSSRNVLNPMPLAETR